MSDIDNNPTVNLGLMPWVCVQCSLPHTRVMTGQLEPREAQLYERRNGTSILMVVANPRFGLPYGRIPRLLLAHLVREYRKTGDRRIVLGRSFAAFIRALGLKHRRFGAGKNGTYTRYKKQALRLFSSDIQNWHASGLGRGTHATELDSFDRLAIADSGQLWWNHPNDSTDSLWENFVVLSERFARSCERAVPVDMDVLQQLRSPFSMDLYCWLTYRAGTAHLKGSKNVISIPWTALYHQFGHNYTRIRDFRNRFKRALGQVIPHYPVRVDCTATNDVKIWPHPPHIRVRPK